MNASDDFPSKEGAGVIKDEFGNNITAHGLDTNQGHHFDKVLDNIVAPLLYGLSGCVWKQPCYLYNPFQASNAHSYQLVSSQSCNC